MPNEKARGIPAFLTAHNCTGFASAEIPETGGVIRSHGPGGAAPEKLPAPVQYGGADAQFGDLLGMACRAPWRWGLGTRKSLISSG